MVLHCPAEIHKAFPEIDIVWREAYVSLKPLYTFQQWCARGGGGGGGIKNGCEHFTFLNVKSKTDHLMIYMKGKSSH